MKVRRNKPPAPAATYDILGLTAGQFRLIVNAIGSSNGYDDDAAGCSDEEGMDLFNVLHKVEAK